jgi:hypothetical protein
MRTLKAGDDTPCGALLPNAEHTGKKKITMTELKVIDTALIDLADYGGCDAPQVEVSAYLAQKAKTVKAWQVARTLLERSAFSSGTKVFLFVLRGTTVNAVEISSTDDVFAANEPYYGYRVVTLADAADMADGYARFVGEWLGEDNGLFVGSRRLQYVLALTAAAIEGTSEYSVRVDEGGNVRFSDSDCENDDC